MKGVSEVLSAVIIIIIALGLTGAAYSWGLPLIQKNQDKTVVDRVQNAFDRDNSNSLTKKIEYVANNGGEETFKLDTNGLWILYPSSDTTPENNSIQFSHASRVSNVATGKGWVPLSSGFVGEPGTLGKDDSSVVFASAEVEGDSYNIRYKAWFREIDESSTKGYKINLVQDTRGSDKSTGSTIRISRGEITQQTFGGKTISVTEVKLLLV